MLAKLFFLAALICFVLAVLVTSTTNFTGWGLAALATGLLVDGAPIR